jgi:cbb3-type cytochrome c oxidase subunit III
MRRSTLIASAAAVVAVLVAAGCGTGGLGDHKADKAKGKVLFSQKCAACHVLADAGSVGNAGPNLDDAFSQVRAQGFKESTIFEVVDKQITLPTERDLKDPNQEVHVNGPLATVQMPANLLTGADRDAVAAYVASVAGLPVKPGSGKPAEAAPAPSTGGSGAADGKAIFTSAGCVACHTLKDAGATGQVGPNLDQAKPDKALVVNRVTVGAPPMPAFKGQLSDDQIQAVADYVSSVAGK